MKRISVIGVDARGRFSHDAEAITSTSGALVFAPGRLCDALSGYGAEPWPTPMIDAFERIDSALADEQPVIVFATGDPMDHGIGATLARRYGADNVAVEPMPSAFSLAAARMGWAAADCALISLHGAEGRGRDVASLERVLAPGARIIALCRDGDTPREVAAWLAARGFGRSELTVLERMGEANENRTTLQADDVPEQTFDGLTTLAIECHAKLNATWYGITPGLPDDAFAHDGQITKQHIRAATIAALRPFRGARLLDVGAGCGSVGIEWLRLTAGSVNAIERSEQRSAMIAENVARFGVGGMNVRQGTAPDAVEGVADMDAVFVGGGIDTDGVAHAAFATLRVGGTLVANVVTLEGEVMLAKLQAEWGGTLSRIAISHAEPIGPFRGWRSAMPVTQYVVGK